MSTHHPDDMTLMNYAAGSLSLPQALAVSVHLCFCHECRDLVKNFNHLGGALLETIKPASTEEDAFDTLMATLEPHDHSQAPKPKLEVQDDARVTQHYTNPLLRYLPASLQDLPWQRQTKEISRFDLTSLINVKGFQVALQKISAGAKVPTHTHKGFEYTVILSGSFSDELGVYSQGDFIARDTTHKHSPTALQNEDCICLTVLNAPLKFTGWYRFLNPLMAWN
ncbi:ChrR family anti-sigma-E factor [Cellvibrio sp. UBA7661]|uniref:ChrR family anti-sigma-E factor n=1 Tax=Cellvibrio sp. UBA7661 TaxID=1946311 RepID=UPI002F354963